MDFDSVPALRQRFGLTADAVADAHQKDIDVQDIDQMLHRRGSLNEYLDFCSRRPEVGGIWLSLYVPRQDETMLPTRSMIAVAGDGSASIGDSNAMNNTDGPVFVQYAWRLCRHSVSQGQAMSRMTRVRRHT